MGADWVKFRIPHDADVEEMRASAAFVSAQYDHGYCLHPDFRDDEATRIQFKNEFDKLRGSLEFPLGSELDYWAHNNLADPLRLDPGQGFDVFDACRVYVISNNHVFPLEWRDASYRTILPDELGEQVERWKRWIDEIRGGKWKHFLHELFLYDRLSDEYQREQLENLLSNARESLNRTNAWCHKEKLELPRERILRAELITQITAMRNEIDVPRFSNADCSRQPSQEQFDREERLFRYQQSAAEQIRDWNRCVPSKWKLRFPHRPTFDEFIAKAKDPWLQSFFSWCDSLTASGHGLFLWA